MQARKSAISLPLQSIYIGGGTPSTLSAETLAHIINTIRATFSIAPNAEFTIEMNPDDVTPAFVDLLIGLGVNRVSLGTQTFSDPLLKLLNRRHDARQAIEAVHLIHRRGITNISIDLIYGLPNQTLNDWQYDVRQAIALPITHLSAYNLMFESGTRLSQMKHQGIVSEAADELIEQMYLHLCQALRQAGFRHYEISNFAKPNFESRHNSGYWNATPYLGIGAGAHSFDGVNRSFNRPDVKQYIAHNGHPPCETEQLAPHERINEYIFTRLRTAEGINLHHLQQTYGHAHAQRILVQAQKYINQGHMRNQHNHLFITENAILISDNIMSEFMIV